MSALANALFTRTQRALLKLLYSNPDRSFFLKEILRHTGMGVSTVKSELDSLTTAEILTLTKIGNQHHFQANANCPIYNELRGIVLKTMGAAHQIEQALQPLKAKIDLAFIFGSFAKGSEKSGSDIDLMVVGSVTFAELIEALYPCQDGLGREINPKLYKADEWIQATREGGSFITDVVNGPKVNIIGDEHELAEFSGEKSGAD